MTVLVEDQSQSNSCAANAIVGAFEYLAKRAEEAGNEDSFADISRLFVYYVGRMRDKQIYSEQGTAMADEGMTIAGAIDVLALKGACLAETFPFDLDNVNTKPPEEAFTEARNFKVSDSREVPVEVEAMKACLAEGYPIVFGLKLTQNFFSPGPGGKIKTPNPDDPQSAEHGLHCMLCVGYSESQQIFIIRNSWGEDWGDNGYAYVPYDYIANPEYNFCGQYAIKDLTETDFTPDEEDDEAPMNEVEDEEEDDWEMEVEEEEWEDEEVEPDPADEALFDAMAEAQAVFDSFDTSGDGQLSAKELGKALRQCGCSLPPKVLEKLLVKFDSDGDGTLSFEEFLSIPGVVPPEMAGELLELLDDEEE